MAEFKLGRIKFVWKDAWSNGTVYYVDDIVRVGARTYICTVGHTSSTDFNTDLEAAIPRWNQFASGNNFRGEWATGTLYQLGDLVKYGGNVYNCNDSHTSAASTTLGREADAAKWDIFVEGLDWQGVWATSTRYKTNELVRYGGITYVCVTGHTSAATATLGLENDQANWLEFNRGIEYLGDWNPASVRYKINDVVKYGSVAWICVTAHTSTATFDVINFQQFVEGLRYESTYNSATTYIPGDIVSYGGNQYIALQLHSNETPSTATSYWALFSEGFDFQGDWGSGTAYKVGQVVRLNGYTYLATADSTAQEPPNITYWQRLNYGIYWRGEWQNSTAYKAGDAVRFETNTFICILAHTSADDDSSTTGDVNLSPATDTTGTYWNALTLGSEISPLSVTGDLVYYGGAGPTRLPIGTAGQVLKVSSNGTPEWSNFWGTDHVYYVKPDGIDVEYPQGGSTLDTAFRTIRYACEQVEKGPRNPNAKYLLELNRVFIQREVTSWIEYQVANATVGSIWETFDYDEYKCERDVGFIVDRLQWDISHGGNLKIRAAAQSLLGILGEGPFSAEEEDAPYATLSSEREQGIAAYNYMLEVVESVLNNESPTVIYQDVADDSTKIAEQYIDLSRTAESGVMTEITSLVSIVTNALANPTQVGTLPTIPERYVPNSLIRVATGQYRETLPIIVPAYACVQGDELRSTNTGPAGSLIDASDSYYTVDTFGHIESFIGDIVTGTEVTPTAGNFATQYREWPVADVDESVAVTELVSVMKQQADYRLGTLHTTSLNDPVGYNVSYLTGYGNARKLIKENKKFLQEEVIAYLVENYPTLKYGKTKTRRDAGYIIDAIIYDLTYGGNALSVQAGLAYWDGDTDTQPQIPASIKSATLAAIEFLKVRMQSVATGALFTPLQDNFARYTDTAGSAGASTLIGNNLNVIIEIINVGPEDAVYTLSDPTPADGVNSSTALIADYTAISASGFDTIQDAVEAYLAANYSDVDYSAAKARRDAAIVTKAIGFDFMFGSVYQTVKAAHAYLRLTASELFDRDDRIKEATRNSLIVARDTALGLMSNATAEARLTTGFKIVDDIIFSGSNEGNVCSTESRNRDYAILQLERNRDFIVSEVGAYISDTFSDTATATTTTTNVITISDTSWLRRGVAIKFTGTVFGNIVAGTTYYVQSIVSSTTFKISATRAGLEFTLSTASGSMNVDLVYDRALCLRDVGTYIDALKWDLHYTSNYKSRYVARYYVNAVLGSLEEDMFYLRDGTGIRDQTLEGLTGDLTPPNEYGTSRVTAGAYVSLDPGWGPDDFRTWIISRSPYVQGVTTIGHAATGQKIDGNLHNGGNDSIVSNDFTQVISDGIGAWVTNNGRAELVSVFTYYSHVGYLAENGGRIRATNGNNSYGDFGAVAEGFDNRETPNTAVVDNQSRFVAEGNVISNGNQAMGIEYLNAGNDYTSAQGVFSGQNGTQAQVEFDEFRDDGIFQLLRTGTGDDSSGQLGGQGYLTAANTAQTGTETTITLAATDSNTSAAYVGMKLYIDGGVGRGQYGIIQSYNSGTKVANIIKESDGTPGFDHFLPGSELFNANATSTYSIEPAVSLSAPGFNSTVSAMPSSGVWSCATYGDTGASYTALTGTYSGTGASGASWTVVRSGSKYTPLLQSAGVGYTRLQTITILGTSLGGATPTNDLIITILAVNSTTGAITEWEDTGHGSGGVFVALRTSASDAAAYSVDGLSWQTATLPSAGTWTGVAHGKVLDGSTVEEISAFVAVRSGSNIAAYSTNGITWSSSTLPESTTWVDVTHGEGQFIAISSTSTTVAGSGDGLTWESLGTLPGTGFTSVAYGMGMYVALVSGSTSAASSVDGVTWESRTLPASSAWNSVTWGNGHFVAVATDSNSGAYSLDGITWTAMTIGSADGSSVSGYQKVAYGQGLFMATTYSAGQEDYSFVSTSENGIQWTVQGVAGGANAISGYEAVAFGNPNRVGYWVVIAKDSGTASARIRTGARARARCSVADEKIFEFRIVEPGSGYDTTPTATITDPNNLYEAPVLVRRGKGVLANPSFTNRGTGYLAGDVTITGNGYADFYQIGGTIAVKWLTAQPKAGSNIVFDHLPSRTFKLVSVTGLVGEVDGARKAFFQISPIFESFEAPEHEVGATTRIRYSQARMTGHDFLDIGTGNFEETNYPDLPLSLPIPANETVENGGGRVFFTATDQDGNFRVGGLFSVEQSTGVATLNADAFNISGLQELSLGEVTLGGGSATISEFSTDPFFTADSDSVIPTQRAIKSYIASQIGGGGASLNVNSLIAGNVSVGVSTISTVTGSTLTINATANFRGGVTGYPLAWSYFFY